MASPIYDLQVKQVNGTVQTYKKVTTGGLINPEDGIPSIYFNEGLVTVFPDGSKMIKDNIGVLSIPYIVGEQFPVLDAEGNTVRMATTDEIYQMLASLYFYKATQRDNS